VIDLSVVQYLMLENGWTFMDRPGVIPDPLHGARFLYEVYTRADRHDDPGALVAEYDRLRHRIDLISRHHIGMAHPGRDDAHQDLVRA